MFKELSNPDTRKANAVEFIMAKAANGLEEYIAKREKDLAVFAETQKQQLAAETTKTVEQSASNGTTDQQETDIYIVDGSPGKSKQEQEYGQGTEASSSAGGAIQKTDAEIAEEVAEKKKPLLAEKEQIEKEIADRASTLSKHNALIVDAKAKEELALDNIEKIKSGVIATANEKAKASKLQSIQANLIKIQDLLEGFDKTKTQLTDELGELEKKFAVVNDKLAAIDAEVLLHANKHKDNEQSIKASVISTSQNQPMTFSSAASTVARTVFSGIYFVAASAITGIRARELTEEKIKLARKLKGMLDENNHLGTYSIDTSRDAVMLYCDNLSAKLDEVKDEERSLLRKHGTDPSSFDARISVIASLLKVLNGEKIEQCVIDVKKVSIIMHRALDYDVQLNDPKIQLEPDTKKRLMFITSLFRVYLELLLDELYSNNIKCNQIPMLPSATRNSMKVTIEEHLGQLLKIDSSVNNEQDEKLVALNRNTLTDEKAKTLHLNSTIGDLQKYVADQQELLEKDRLSMVPDIAANALSGFGVPITTRNAFLDDLSDFLTQSGPKREAPHRWTFKSVFGA